MENKNYSGFEQYPNTVYSFVFSKVQNDTDIDNIYIPTTDPRPQWVSDFNEEIKNRFKYIMSSEFKVTWDKKFTSWVNVHIKDLGLKTRMHEYPYVWNLTYFKTSDLLAQNICGTTSPPTKRTFHIDTNPDYTTISTTIKNIYETCEVTYTTSLTISLNSGNPPTWDCVISITYTGTDIGGFKNRLEEIFDTKKPESKSDEELKSDEESESDKLPSSITYSSSVVMFIVLFLSIILAICHAVFVLTYK